MNREINIEEVRSFVIAANKQFEQGGIFLERIKFNRDEKTGALLGLALNYEDRTGDGSGSKEKEG